MYLKSTRCYLSGAIENDHSDINWREKPIKILTEKFGIDLFDPFSDPKQQWTPLLKEARQKKDYNKMQEIASGFVRKDLCLVDRSDFLIAYLPKGVCTTGTHHEIINSVNSKKPTLLICPHGKENIPLWYYGFIPHEVMFNSWEELYNYLEEVDKGLHKQNRRWSFVYKII